MNVVLKNWRMTKEKGALNNWNVFQIYNEVKGHNAETGNISSTLMDEQKRKNQENQLAKLFTNIILVRA